MGKVLERAEVEKLKRSPHAFRGNCFRLRSDARRRPIHRNTDRPATIGERTRPADYYRNDFQVAARRRGIGRWRQRFHQGCHVQTTRAD